MKKVSPVSNADKIEQLLILVVDDDAIIRMLHQHIVKAAAPACPVFACKNGEEAVNHLLAGRAGTTRFLVLLDINMPVMNGWEFLQHCQKARISNLMVVMVSSSGSTSDRLRAASFPQVFRYCEKPLDSTTFAEILSQVERRIFSGPS